MINWFSVFINSFWIVGLALILATLSYHHWAAKQAKRSFRAQLNEHSFLLAWWIGLVLIGVGLAGTSQRWWETAVWIILTLAAVVNALKLNQSTGSGST